MISNGSEEERERRSVTFQNAKSILSARQRTEREFLLAQEELEAKTRELAQSLALMRATFESTTDAFLVTDANRWVTGYNQKYVEMWGFSHSPELEKDHGILLKQIALGLKNPSEFLDRVDEIYRTSPLETLDALELNDGRVIERHSRIQFIGEKNVGRVWSFRDITERRRAEAEREKLLEAERAARTEAERVNLLKDEFLATLSHELRTPLNSILGWSQILASGRYRPEELSQGLEIIARNSRAQKQLIEDLLDMSRIISGKVRLSLQRTDLGEIVETAVNALLPSAQAKGIHIQKVIDPVAKTVVGDPSRLQQVVWNLLSNAIKFTPEYGSVAVHLRRHDDDLELSVRDSGLGIKEEFIARVFDRFRQADSSSTRKFGGLGLGLSIVKNLVELHRGTVRVESAGVGKGATFTVHLPSSPKGASEILSDSGEESMDFSDVNLAGIRILVVEDERDSRHLVERLLTQCRAQVLMAASAREGLQLLRAAKPDVLISDISMPDKDGYQFIHEVRQLSVHEGGRIPAIALTAFARSEDRTRAMMAGFQMHIAKPIEPQELLVTVANLAGRTPSQPPSIAD